MKFSKEVNDNGSEFKKSGQKPNPGLDTKTSDENKDLSASKLEDNDASSCALEPSATALIPPWIRSSLGLNEKGSKPNQKCFKTLPASSERGFTVETTELKTDIEDECKKTNFLLKDSSSVNPIIEVNIGHETDFPEDNTETGTKLSVWRSRGSKRNQYECNIFSVCKDKRLARAVKSEVTSIDVVVPMDDHEDEKRKIKSHKSRNKMYKRTSVGGLKSEEPCKAETDNRNRDVDIQKREYIPNGMKKLDSRLLLLCGKNTIDNLTEEDVSLLQEMKNQIGHKEGLEKLFSEIKESSLLDKNFEVGKTKKDDGEKLMREVFDNAPFVPNQEDSETKIVNSLMNKAKMMEEERKYLEEIKRHYEKKKWSQQRKYSEEAEPEKKPDKYKMPQRMKETDKKKLRHGDYSVIEKAVSETLQRFIEVYRFQIPPDTVSSMKKNIVQTLQSEYTEPRKNMGTILTIQEQGKTETKRGSIHTLLLDDKEEKSRQIYKTVSEVVHTFTGEENIVSKDTPNEEVKMPFRTVLVGSENKFPKVNDAMEDENIKDLKKVFEKCLVSIQAQLDINSAKLSSFVLEKTDEDDKPNTKMRIVYSITNGVTESIKVYKENMGSPPLNMGSPEGDNVNTSMKVCECQRLEGAKITRNQYSQTNDKILTKNSTQTDYFDVSAKQMKNTELSPGLYRIIKATDLGRLYLCPEALHDEIQRTNSDIYDTPENLFFNEVSESFSRETFISERLVLKNNKVQRAVKSDCLGLNSCDLIRRESLVLADASKPEQEVVVAEMEPGVEDDEGGGEKEGEKDEGEKGEGEKEEEEEEGEEEEEEEEEEGKISEKEDSQPEERVVCKSRSYHHVGCVWLWNGKKIDPGVDLKVHVEDLLREKIREILGEVKTEVSKNAPTGNENFFTADGLDENLETRKTHASFSICNKRPFVSEVTPFIFGGSPLQDTETISKALEEENVCLHAEEDTCTGKSVREVGTQNSQHTFVSLNITKLKPRSKLWTVAKFSKQRGRKQIFAQRGRMERFRPPTKAFSFAENVGEAKKVKLEIRESNEVASNNEKGSNTESVRECFSIISNGSSSSTDGPVRVKLIGIEVSKEKKSPGDSEMFDRVSDENKFSEEESPSKEKIGGLSREQSKRYKHWELIENVLNRVNQKEKDSLWNDIREFVKKKIGKDINDEGAREVCIEIEQDVPKFAKGKSSHAVVARGNYSRNEGDVEVEVDLTLDDLERILRHRQKKQRRRQKYQNKKSRVELKKSTSSAVTSEGASDSVLNYNNLVSNCSAFGEYVTPSEIKVLKQHRLQRDHHYSEAPVEVK